jgi:hypothetical protein
LVVDPATPVKLMVRQFIALSNDAQTETIAIFKNNAVCAAGNQ